MISNPLYLISYIIGTLLAFFIAAAVVDALIFSMRIKNRRMRAFLRLVPFASLLLDLFFNKLSMGSWLNPLICGSCVQNVLLQVFNPQLKTYLFANEISLMNYLALEYASPIFSTIFFSFFSVTAASLTRKAAQTFMMIRRFRRLVQKAKISPRKIENPLLNSAIEKKNIRIYTSGEVFIPVASSHVIVLPERVVNEASQDEYETIIAHEFEHILWKDPLSRMFSELISALFWWIPTRSRSEKFKQEQEMACDQSIFKYGYESESLASALIKAAKEAKIINYAPLCSLGGEKKFIKTRVKSLLDFDLKKEKLCLAGLVALGAGAAAALACLLI